MRSFPIDERLAALAAAYDQALEALLRDDLPRVANLLDQADDHLQALATADPTGDREAAIEAVRQRAGASLGCLRAALSRARDLTRDELRQLREGRRALRSYGRRAPGNGPGFSC